MPISSRAKTRSTVLCGWAVIEPEHPAEALTALDRAFSERLGRGRDERIAETLVWPFLVIVRHEFSNSRPKMPFAKWYDSPQALSAN
jgi:hypothetical protein